MGILEALSGMAFDVQFISFDDLKTDENILDEVGAIINAGDAYTAFSGGANWADEEILTKIRALDRKSTRLNSSHITLSCMPSSA